MKRSATITEVIITKVEAPAVNFVLPSDMACQYFVGLRLSNGKHRHQRIINDAFDAMSFAASFRVGAVYSGV